MNKAALSALLQDMFLREEMCLTGVIDKCGECAACICGEFP